MLIHQLLKLALIRLSQAREEKYHKNDMTGPR